MDHTFTIYNFGCKVNQEEGGALAALFIAAGWRYVPEDQPAELVIVNTCTVTATADKKVRNLLRRLRREQPGCLLAACGCYAQRDPDALTALGVDIVAGVDDRRRLLELVNAYQNGTHPIQMVGEIANAHGFQTIAPRSRQQRARAYLKVEDGCDQFCNYCIIPHVRGPVRSLPLDQAVEEARLLLEAGHKELVLTGIHIGAYGQDLPAGQDLPHLLEALCALPGLDRLRLGSVEPQHFTTERLQTLATLDKVCPHFHIPLQSGCEKTLAAMGRHYDPAAYGALLDRLRRLVGDPAFTTDVMVGYPGETEADFLESQGFCQSCGFAAMHVFPYSRRSGTPAAVAPDQVPQGVKADRAARLAETAAAGSRAYRSRYRGKPLSMLVEERVDLAGKTYWKGHSENYLLLYLPQEKIPVPIFPGSLVPVTGVDLLEDGLLAMAPVGPAPTGGAF